MGPFLGRLGPWPCSLWRRLGPWFSYRCEAVLVQLERHFDLLQGYLGFPWQCAYPQPATSVGGAGTGGGSDAGAVAMLTLPSEPQQCGSGDARLVTKRDGREAPGVDLGVEILTLPVSRYSVLHARMDMGCRPCWRSNGRRRQLRKLSG